MDKVLKFSKYAFAASMVVFVIAFASGGPDNMMQLTIFFGIVLPIVIPLALGYYIAKWIRKKMHKKYSNNGCKES